MGAGGHDGQVEVAGHSPDRGSQVDQLRAGVSQFQGRLGGDLDLRLQHLGLDIARNPVPAGGKELPDLALGDIPSGGIVDEVLFFDAELEIPAHFLVSSNYYAEMISCVCEPACGKRPNSGSLGPEWGEAA
ncbi:MAG: hypothetical protein K0R61_2561 [Microvirga sp.]|nr:hypothetical protein [Microvirga sp.]